MLTKLKCSKCINDIYNDSINDVYDLNFVFNVSEREREREI